MHSKKVHSSVLSEKVFETIKQKGITPKPRWHFFLKEWVVWVVAFLALAIGSVATALTLYIVNASRFIEHRIIFSDSKYIFQFIPLLWIVLGGVAIFYTVYALRETNRGYKWNSAWLVGLALGLSMFLGVGVYVAGLSEKIDLYLLREIPPYRPLSNFEPKMWMADHSGIIAGVVIEVNDEFFVLQKIDGDDVRVKYSPEFLRAEHPVFEQGMRVRLIGTSTVESGEEVFIMHNIEPFRGRGGMMRRPPMYP